MLILSIFAKRLLGWMTLPSSMMSILWQICIKVYIVWKFTNSMANRCQLQKSNIQNIGFMCLCLQKLESSAKSHHSDNGFCTTLRLRWWILDVFSVCRIPESLAKFHCYTTTGFWTTRHWKRRDLRNLTFKKTVILGFFEFSTVKPIPWPIKISSLWMIAQKSIIQNDRTLGHGL